MVKSEASTKTTTAPGRRAGGHTTVQFRISGGGSGAQNAKRVRRANSSPGECQGGAPTMAARFSRARPFLVFVCNYMESAFICNAMPPPPGLDGPTREPTGAEQLRAAVSSSSSSLFGVPAVYIAMRDNYQVNMDHH